MEVTQDIFEQQRRPRFGTANPERMQLAFWEWMIGEDQGAAAKFPYDARRHFSKDVSHQDAPIWTFQRYGATRTKLPDGRVICTGGEHEDFYDPDFYIYNDVVVFGPAGEIEIYGYPREVFPPTDFHTATLVGDRIILIGGLGYVDARRPSDTPVYALNLANYQISKITSSGELPGWICEHACVVNELGVIALRGGHVIELISEKQHFKQNVDEYTFDPSNGIWHRLTDRKWPQFSIRREDRGLFVLKHEVTPKNLLPPNLERTSEPGEEWRQARFVVKGVPVQLDIAVDRIDLIVEGELPAELCAKLAEAIRANAEATIKQKCTLLALASDSPGR